MSETLVEKAQVILSTAWLSLRQYPEYAAHLSQFVLDWYHGISESGGAQEIDSFAPYYDEACILKELIGIPLDTRAPAPKRPVLVL